MKLVKRLPPPSSPQPWSGCPCYQSRGGGSRQLTECVYADRTENPLSPSSSSVGSWTETHRLHSLNYFAQGQLRLGVKVLNNCLILHIGEASGLKSQWRAKATAYVQTQICPDEQETCRQQTEAVPETNAPVYSHTVQYDLATMESLQKKRVMISVWHKDPVKNCAEFIGCLSFGLSHLVAKCRKQEMSAGISGWYYLLSAEIGHRKHILARTTEVGVTEEPEKEENKENEPQKYKALTFVMQHRAPGYGFTVRGPNPIRVGRIKSGGPAHGAGIKKGDIIVRINGQTMGDTDMQLVAEIIRQSDVEVVMDVLRKISLAHVDLKTESQQSDSSDCVLRNNKLTPRSVKCKLGDTVGQLKRKCDFSHEEFEHASKKSHAVVGSENGLNNQNLFDEGLFCKPYGKRMLPHSADIPQWTEDSIANQKLCNIYGAPKQKQCDRVNFITNQFDSISKKLGKENRESPKLTEKNILKVAESEVLSKYRKWNPEISSITTASSQVQNLVESLASEDDYVTFTPLNTRLESFVSSDGTSSSVDGNVPQASPLYNTLQSSSSQASSLKHCALSPSQYGGVSLEYPSRCSSPTSSVSESRVADMTDFENVTSGRLECSMGSERELCRDLSVRTLIKCEEEYVRCMQRDIQTYSRPLRYSTLSTQHNKILFQNIEKLAAISQYNLSQVVDSRRLTEHSVNGSMAPNHSPAQNIADIYQATVSTLCQGYMEYIDGLPAATQLLAQLKHNTDFQKTLQKQTSQCDRDLLAFLQQPLLHFEFLHRAFQEIYSHTVCDHADFTALQRVVDKFAEVYAILF